MSAIRSACPGCAASIEFEEESSSIICASCGNAYLVRRHQGAFSLTSVTSESVDRDLAGPGAIESIDRRLSELDELLSEGEAEIEAIRSREQSGPLGIGCSFFGLFFAVVGVIVLFMVLGRNYFGGWLFYLTIVAVLLIGLKRIRAKRPKRTELEQLREDRARMEAAAKQLQEDRKRLLHLRSMISTRNKATPPGED